MQNVCPLFTVPTSLTSNTSNITIFTQNASKIGLGIDTNFTIRFDSILIHKLAIRLPIRFNIDYFGYISGTVHTKFSQGKTISQLIL